MPTHPLSDVAGMERKKVMLVFGTRPEAVKMATLAQALRDVAWCEPIVAVTAQHREMLDQVMELFELTADFDLDMLTPGQTLTDVTVKALTGLGPILESVKPDAVVVQGDTTTTFAGALASFYRQIPVVHMEAGLRTDDPASPFPEEINRRLATQLTTLHLAATPTSRDNLLRDGVARDRVVVTGNTVIDALHWAVDHKPSYDNDALEAIDGSTDRVLLVTAHRRESWGEPMRSIGLALADLSDRYPSLQIVFPIHRNPLVRDAILPSVKGRSNVTILEPLAYGAFSRLMARATLVLTDSGGVQEEAPSLGKPVLVLRDTTERPEAVLAGTAKLVGTDRERIVAEVSKLLDDPDAYQAMATAVNPYGDGRATERTIAAIAEMFGVGSRIDEFVG
jgi:UDP-N-acetylglucosamine 2-epimerase (non-hydrolysing)